MTLGLSRFPVGATGLTHMIPGITIVGGTLLVGISRGAGMIPGGAIVIGAGADLFSGDGIVLITEVGVGATMPIITTGYTEAVVMLPALDAPLAEAVTSWTDVT